MVRAAQKISVDILIFFLFIPPIMSLKNKFKVRFCVPCWETPGVEKKLFRTEKSCPRCGSRDIRTAWSHRLDRMGLQYMFPGLEN